MKKLTGITLSLLLLLLAACGESESGGNPYQPIQEPETAEVGEEAPGAGDISSDHLDADPIDEGMENDHLDAPPLTGDINSSHLDWGTHVVAAGDTLFSIAQAHGIHIADLQRWNNLGDSDHIVPGQLLIVDGSLAPMAVSPNRPMNIIAHQDVSYPHPFGNEDSNVTFMFNQGEVVGTLVMDFGETVRNLSFVPVLFEAATPGNYIWNFQVASPFAQAPQILDNQYLLIHNWIETAGSVFNQGLVFTDQDGAQRQFIFGIDNKRGGITFAEIIDGVAVLQQGE